MTTGPQINPHMSPWAATPEGVRCEFVDGRTAKRHDAYVTIAAGEGVLELRYAADPRQDAWGEDVSGETLLLTWPLSQLRYVEGQHKLRWGKVPMGVFTDVTSPTARLYVRDGLLLSEIRGAARNLKRRAPVTGKGRIAGLISGAVASVLLIVFVLIPAIADQLAMRLPVEGERALGDKTYERIRESFSQNEYIPIRECTKGAGLSALASMQDTLVGASDLDPEAVRLTVLDFDMVNAFALPGGRIVVMRGLIDEAGGPNEVAAVIAHEIGHVAHRDPTRHALRGVGTFGVLSLVFGDFAGGTVVLLGVNQLVNAQYSQEAESAADTYAHALLPKIGVSPGALAPLFERLKEKYGDTEGLASHLASHPKLGDRVERAHAAAAGFAAETQPILSDAAWEDLRDICE
ncbi:M48 family metallopeptidase [Celeribacter sp. PS-C1]|uniref:M48 family metallopeptidase n=1 Tax=Celeribacter sp. PS-C1 TaxID=2820813 RepID=UPI001C6837CF|nr:M48 family metallopeptidase [Celeribacter sp. PS-C1]MBW6419772.1 M48 family metallopeptidase [Celeribacter sp. PS-C1]